MSNGEVTVEADQHPLRALGVATPNQIKIHYTRNLNYRIEIYVPKVKRQYGYYVLPILHGDQLIGRIDSKMDRKTNRYAIHKIYLEPSAKPYIKTGKAVIRAIESLGAFIGANTIDYGDVPARWGR